jgi:tartrate-resistant acid phosphatase type 5
MEPLAVSSSPHRRKASTNRTLLLLSVFFAVFLVLVLAIALRSTIQTGTADSVTFFVVGDWGREGTRNQTNVAALMSKVSTSLAVPPVAVISTGDNMYPNGLNSSDDPLFDASFRDVYNGKGLDNVPWYAVLGNHDYGDGFWTLCENDQNTTDCDRGPQHQLGDNLHRRDARWNMPDRSYVKSFGGGIVDIFFVDTNPMISEYRNSELSPWNKHILEAGDWRESLDELNHRLSASGAQVKLVVGHHPTRSNGDHGPNVDLVEHLEPVLNANGVAAYFSGHDHDLEHLKAEDMRFHQVVSGAGSDCTRGFHGTESSVFQYAWSGFTMVTVDGGSTPKVAVRFYTVEHGGEKPAHEFVV